MGVDRSNSVNNNRLLVLNYNKYFLLFTGS